MSGTDPDPRPDRPIDSTRAYRPDDAAAQPQPAANLPRIPGITLHFELARGGMGVVYSGRQDFLDRRVAVKLLSVELGGESFVQRFQREAKILAGIKHPNIVACHMAGQTDDGQSYLVMEFIDGPSLKKWISDHGPVPVKAALRTTRAVGAALAHAFTLGVIHRDVKPENILLETVTSTALDVTFPFTPKVVDLGLARASSGSASLGLTSPGSVMGTPATMSPEQYDEPDAVDFRTDIYGLGCALYEMLVGRPAFRGKRLSDIVAKKREPVAPDPCAENPDVPAAVGALVQSMLATDREDRPRSYRDLDEQLTALLGAIGSAPTRAPAAGRFVGEETEVTMFRRPTAAPGGDAPAPAAKTAKVPGAKEPPKEKAGGGPGLLKTAEINFLAEALGEPGAAGPANAEPAFHTRPPAGGAPAVPQWSTRPPAAPTQPEPVGGTTHTSAPPVPPTPLVERSRRGVIVGAVIGIAALAGIAMFLAAGRDDPANGGEGGGARGRNVAPVLLPLKAPANAIVGTDFDAEVVASDADGDDLTYVWSWPPELLKCVRGANEPKARFEVFDGLDRVEASISVEVRDGKSLPARRLHTLALAAAKPQRPVMGFKTDGRWVVDKDQAWTPIYLPTDPKVSCQARNERRTLFTRLGDEAYWEWYGSLESAEDEGTPHARLGLRFEFGDRGFVVESQRRPDGDSFTVVTRVLTAERVGEGWNETPLAEPVEDVFREPVQPDDVKEGDLLEHRGWFSVERRKRDLWIEVGHASRAASATDESVVRSGNRVCLPLPEGRDDANLTLFVDKGIGRFRVQRR